MRKSGPSDSVVMLPTNSGVRVPRTAANLDPPQSDNARSKKSWEKAYLYPGWFTCSASQTIQLESSNLT